MAVDPTDSGSVSDDTDNGPYTAGTRVIVSAEAKDGYEFVNWTAPSGAFADDTSANTTFNRSLILCTHFNDSCPGRASLSILIYSI